MEDFAAARCIYGAGDDCTFRCHCLEDTECGGLCPSGCDTAALGYNWGGPACQIGNIALGKRAFQTGTANWDAIFVEAKNAVDGKVPILRTEGRGAEYCAHPEGDRARWWVDLGDMYKIYNVTIYFRLGCCYSRNSQFTISVMNSSTGAVSVCAYQGPDVQVDSTTLPCSTPLIGDRVQFIRDAGIHEQDLATLCEVIVIGHKYIDKDCSKCPVGVSCNDVIGCEGCSGSYPPDCKQACEDGNYGINCASTCGQCEEQPCDKSTGNCSGCERGHYGVTCHTRCGHCNVENTAACDQATGRCPDGCQMWYIEDTCQTLVGEIMNQSSPINVEEVTASSISISWTALSVTVGTESHYGYEVRFRHVTENEYQKYKSLRHSATSDHLVRLTISGLERNTTYNVQVVPYRTWEGIKEFGTPYLTLIYKTLELGDPSVIPVAAGTGGAVVAIGVILAVILISRRRKRTRQKDNTDTDTPDGDETSSAANGNVVANLKPEIKEKPKLGLARHRDIEVGDHHAELALVESVEDNGDTSKKSILEESEKLESKALQPSIVTIPHPHELGYSGPDEHVYGNTSNQTVSIKIHEFEAYVMTKKNNSSFKAEYESLPQDDKERCPTGQTKLNKKKNRFLNIYPYDETRVILHGDDGGVESDYINANYIKGFKHEKEYIATQGPKDTTVGDFWRMIWQEGSNRIIMVANVKENGKLRCHPYWADDVGSEVHQGAFTITTVGLESCADYTTRILTVTKQEESRTVRQFHFTSWEDKNKPKYGATTLLCFFRKVHAFDKFSKGPLIVHCSAGVGRTGTFIALDILQQQAKYDGSLSVYSCVYQLRTQRMSMVQTQEQYIYVHDAMVEYIQCGDTSYECSGFRQTFSVLCQPEPQLGGISQLEKQFKLLSSKKTTAVHPDSDGLAAVHRDKNRDITVIPDDNNRLYLTGRGNENYINAVYVDSFKAHDFYVVTQMPLPATIPAFWKLVFEQKTQSIVMLNQIVDGEDPYWPHGQNKTRNFGAIEVTLMSTDDTTKNIIIRNFSVKNKSKMSSASFKVRHFQLLSWPNTEALPPDRGSLLNLLAVLQVWYQQNISSYLARRADKEDSSPKPETLVHCLTGGVQSGLFCAVSHTLDRMKVEQEIDAFLAARYITRRRPQYMNTLVEYRFIFEMAIEYMSQYEAYANFQ